MNATNKFERRISRKGAPREEKRFTLFISNEDIDNIIKIVKTSVDSKVLIDGVTETVKHETKKQEGRFIAALLAPLAASLLQPVISSVMKGITGRTVMRAGRVYDNNMDKYL